MKIPVGYKFAVVGQTVWPEAPKILFPLRFDGRLWATSFPPFHIDDTWKEWLGLRAGKFAESNMFLIAAAPSAAPEVLDDENRKLEKLVRLLYVATAIEGLFFEGPGLTVSGARLPEPRAVEVRAVSDTTQFFHPGGYHGPEITARLLVRSAQMANNLERLVSLKPAPRLLKGVFSLILGLESRIGEQRLHAFVRSVDAVMKLHQGSSLRQFTHRGQIFAGRTERDRVLLKQLYLLRSAAEHMNPLDSVLVDYPEYERMRVAMQRAVQAELLAKFVYGTILRSDLMTSLFSNDGWLHEFWALKDHELTKFWGATVDLHEIDPLPASFPDA